MINKALQIKNLYREMQEEGNLISLGGSVGEVIQFHIFEIEDFLTVARENNKKFEVNRSGNPELYKFRFTTETEGVSFLFLTDSVEEYNRILEELF